MIKPNKWQQHDQTKIMAATWSN